MKLAKNFIIITFVTLYLVTSSISTIHSIDFFKLSNPDWLAISLAVAFEIGAAASLASIITLDKMNKGIVWGLFIVLTLMQVMSNLFYSYTHLHDYQSWVELFGFIDSDNITQKRYVSIISGAILPLVALGFIKSLVDYMQPTIDVENVVTPIEQEAVRVEEVIPQIPEAVIIDDVPMVEELIQDSVIDKIKVFKNSNGN